MDGENRLYTVLSVAGGFFCLAASLFFQSAPAAALGGLFFLLTIALWKYGYVLIPVLVKNAKVVEIGRNFEIPPSQDAVVGRSGGRFLATVFLAARLYESASEKREAARIAMGEMFEKAVSSAGFPFKVCCLVSPLDLRGELDEIRTKRSLAETRRASLRTSSKDDSEAARLEREIAMWGRQIDALTSGQKPLEVIFYLSTTANGITQGEAVARARSQSEELAVVVGSALSCEVVQLKGEDMKRVFWWEFFGPADAEDLKDQLF